MVKATSHLANPIYIHADISRNSASLQEFGKVLLVLLYLPRSMLPQ